MEVRGTSPGEVRPALHWGSDIPRSLGSDSQSLALPGGAAASPRAPPLPGQATATLGPPPTWKA
eukprot:14926740-Alexandrium_andersonii.AAC.1